MYLYAQHNQPLNNEFVPTVKDVKAGSESYQTMSTTKSLCVPVYPATAAAPHPNYPSAAAVCVSDVSLSFRPRSVISISLL